MITKILKNIYLKIFIIVLFSIIIDSLFILNIDYPPAWDQGYHLSNVFKMYNILESNNINILEKINHLLNVTNSYRGPLSYFLSALFLKLSEKTYHYAYFSNQIFSLICIFSIFNLAKLLKNESTGIWASIIFTSSSLIISQRSDYLIDLSLTAFCSLNLFFFSKWYLDSKKISIYPILSGISFGFIFITKPTGIALFCFPLLMIIFKLIRENSKFLTKTNQIILFIFPFIGITFPWFSINWLTILSSTINAWNWGVNYQDGLGIKSFDSWIYYFKKLPSIFGVINSSIFFIIFITEKIYQRNLLKLRLKKINDINLYFLSFLLNCYLIVSLMSSKDVRFIMPLYPLICIYLALFIESNVYKVFSSRNKKNILLISILISIFTNNDLLISNLYKSNTSYKWPHKDIIEEIKNDNKNLVSILAVLPDTKEINTFNLEAEAARQDESVAVRQIISNNKTYKDDLKYYDWFLLKTGEQGIMSNKSKNLLNTYLLNNNSFSIHKEWLLPDKSKVMLLRRKLINTSLTKVDCNNDLSKFKVKQIKNGLNIEILEKGDFLKSSNLLINFKGNEFKKFTNLSLANDFFNSNFDPESCYNLSQNIAINFPNELNENLFLTARIINQDGFIKDIKLEDNRLLIKSELTDSDYIQMANRISEVERLGNFLREGEFKKLFNLVGIINQSDPKQKYLKNAEKIYLTRYKDKENLSDLYNLLISQILQRKISEAEKTINIILKIDIDNGNSHLTKSIINIYQLNRKGARESINAAKNLKKSEESNEILKSIEGINYLLEMKFINAYKNFNLKA